jgi:NADPH:quinone reductase-like Zn-dependent oxidoreductase
MRAIVIEKFGGVDGLVYKDIPEPEPKSGHVVIQSVLRLLKNSASSAASLKD